MDVTAMALHACPACGARQWVRSDERTFVCAVCSAPQRHPGSDPPRAPEAGPLVVLDEPEPDRR